MMMNVKMQRRSMSSIPHPPSFGLEGGRRREWLGREISHFGALSSFPSGGPIESVEGGGLLRERVSSSMTWLLAWPVLGEQAESSCQPPRALQIQAVAIAGGDTGLLN